jgi:predicted HTH transcriptional regulator
MTFVINQKVQMIEDEFTEFKSYWYPNQDFAKQLIVKKIVVAFLNHKGGKIYFGIDDTGIVVRVNLMNPSSVNTFINDLINLTHNIKPSIKWISNSKYTL